MVLLTGSIVASYSFGDNPNPNPTCMSKKLYESIPMAPDTVLFHDVREVLDYQTSIMSSFPSVLNDALR
jgi:hypothetical protein